ncbi:MAG: Uma2 family endonuclease [Pyrinomonadaceae bacterium MAG19_C2-C3]|nr:Uma2 family endonuclease [Pyrinomonadaceae bacterium MAG19_C2-C3]
MAVAISPPESGVILENISWDLYEGLLREHSDSASPRFTYNNGVLELMILSQRHEQPNRMLARVVEVAAEELEIDVECLGSMTCRREDMLRGFEPDSCFYIQNLERVFGRDELDFTVDPPPDLVIEIDITHPSLPKFPIFAAFGVPEVWRYDGERVEIFMLNASEYVKAENSLCLSVLTSEALTEFLQSSRLTRPTQWTRELRAWVQQHKG